jgi:hypothetical protein
MACGCHLKRGGKWVLYTPLRNECEVRQSQQRIGILVGGHKAQALDMKDIGEGKRIINFIDDITKMVIPVE